MDASHLGRNRLMSTMLTFHQMHLHAYLPAFGVAGFRLLADCSFFMAGVERDMRSVGLYINHRLLPTTVSATSNKNITCQT